LPRYEAVPKPQPCPFSSLENGTFDMEEPGSQKYEPRKKSGDNEDDASVGCTSRSSHTPPLRMRRAPERYANSVSFNDNQASDDEY
jgi:hypothetical protein